MDGAMSVIINGTTGISGVDGSASTPAVQGTDTNTGIFYPAWDKDAEYINRENRPEWNIIGLLGQVKILKGQPVGDRWTKMRDVSATVEEWMIR